MRWICVPSVAGIVMTAAMLTASSAVAEPLEQRVVPSRPDRSSAAPEIVDRDLRPAQPAVPQRPGFIENLSKQTGNGRVGAAGWTAPSSPTGARGTADPERSGVFGGGFAAEWN